VQGAGAGSSSSRRPQRQSSHTNEQVLSISGNIDDAQNKVSVEDRSTDAGDDYSDFSRGN
jgi:hypothetical protein